MSGCGGGFFDLIVLRLRLHRPRCAVVPVSRARFAPVYVGAPANNNDRERVGVAFRVTQQNEQNRNEQAP